MFSTRSRAAAATLAGVTAIGLAAPAVATAATAHQAAAPAGKARASGHGLFVADKDGHLQRVEDFGTPSALVRDPEGREHLVTTKPSSTHPGEGHIAYFTRDSAHAHWRQRVVPGLIPLAGGVQVESHLSGEGHRVFAVFYRCDGIYVVDASAAARQLPEPTRIYRTDNCADAATTSSSPPVARAGSVVGDDVSVLVHDTSSANAPWVVLSGRPGATFGDGAPFATPPLPTSDGFTPQQMVVDTSAREMIVAGTGTDGTSLGIYVTTVPWIGGAWSGPTRIATLSSGTTDYGIEALVAYRGRTYVGLSRPAIDGVAPKHALYLVKGLPSGQWRGAVPVPHTTSDDRDLRLAFNTATTHLHAAWTRHVPGSAKRSGLMHEAQNVKGQYPKPVFITHSRHDVATQITITNSRAPIIGVDR